MNKNTKNEVAAMDKKKPKHQTRPYVEEIYYRTRIVLRPKGMRWVKVKNNH